MTHFHRNGLSPSVGATTAITSTEANTSPTSSKTMYSSDCVAMCPPALTLSRFQVAEENRPENPTGNCGALFLGQDAKKPSNRTLVWLAVLAILIERHNRIGCGALIMLFYGLMLVTLLEV